MTAFSNIAPCNFDEADRCFRDTYYFHNQGDEDKFIFEIILKHMNVLTKDISVGVYNFVWTPTYNDSKKTPAPVLLTKLA
jgi:hypothetical protein